MRVLFFAADGISAPVRIVPMLETLRREGQIEGYACVDRNMSARGAGSQFDVLLVHRNPGKRQIAWLRRAGVPFVYDIDDLLLSADGDLSGRRAQEQDAIRWCLGNALLVTSPSRHLLTMLERRLGAPLSARARYLPNSGGSDSVTANGNHVPSPRLLWVSSHGQDYAEFHDVARGLAAAARATGSGVVLVGKFSHAVLEAVADARHVPWVEPRRFDAFLAEGGFIAASPMPVALAREEQDFVDCKSDIKAAQYGMRGIDGVYSPARPYRDSDIPCRMSAGNAAANWEAGLVQAVRDYPAPGRALPDHAAVRARRPGAVAAQLLAMLHEAQAKTGGPFRFRALSTPSIFRRAEQGLRALRARLSGAP